MRYLALASDYDGTLAHDGKVDDRTVAALEKWRAGGRHLILVTGRELPELLESFPQINLFELAVVENGALLYNPASREEHPLAEAPPAVFIEALRSRGVSPLSAGRCIVATWDSQQEKVLDAIRELGLELQMIFNKGSLMVLPSGVNKATGLCRALEELGLSTHNTIAAGDAENDHAMLSSCECGVAVANALPTLKERADLVTEHSRGAGIVELIDRVLKDELAGLNLDRHDLVIGRSGPDPVRIKPDGAGLLLAGPSGSGKSTLSTTILERFLNSGYQFCVVDPEGDYQTLEGATLVGDPRRAPMVDEVVEQLSRSTRSLVVNLLGVPLNDRPRFFASLGPGIEDLRTRKGRPHWMVIDEAHHLMPARPGVAWNGPRPAATLMITVHPDQMAPEALEAVDVVIAVGQSPENTLDSFRTALHLNRPPFHPVKLEKGQALAWYRRPDALVRFDIDQPRGERQRHRRKYAEGELPEESSFYFRGPDGRLKLRAHNLMFFVQIASGVDDDTWAHHLRRHDYSTWFRGPIKDAELAEAVEAIENNEDLTPQESREAVRKAIEERFTLPARQASGIYDTSGRQ